MRGREVEKSKRHNLISHSRRLDGSQNRLSCLESPEPCNHEDVALHRLSYADWGLIVFEEDMFSLIGEIVATGFDEILQLVGNYFHLIDVIDGIEATLGIAFALLNLV